MTIRSKFVLEGLETIIAQLRTFGKSGEHAAKQLQDAINKINTRQMEESLKGIQGSFDDVLKSVVNFKTIIAGTGIGLLTKAIIDFTKAGIDSAVTIERNAAAAGISAQSYQVLSEAMKAAGGSQEQLNNALRRFTMQVDTQSQEQLKTFTDVTKFFVEKTGGISSVIFRTAGDFQKLSDAAATAAPLLKSALEALNDPRGAQSIEAIQAKVLQLLQQFPELRKQFNQLGISTPAQNIIESLDKINERAKGTLASLGITLIDLGNKTKTPEKAFLEFVDVVSKMRTESEQSQAIIKVFGRTAGPELAKLIREGTTELARLQQFLQSRGIIFSPEQLASAKAADDAFNRLSASYRSFRDQLSISIAPDATRFIDDLTTNITEFSQSGGLEKIKGGIESIASGGKTIKDAFDQVAADLNKFVSTDLTGSELMIGLVALKASLVALGPLLTLLIAAAAAFSHTADESLKNIQRNQENAVKDQLGILEKLEALKRVPQIMAERPELSAFQAVEQALADLRTKSQQTSQSASTDWNAFDTRFSQMSNDVVDAGNKILLNWQQLQKTSQATTKPTFFTPPAPGTNPFAPLAPITPATMPEQQATQTQNLISPFQQADDQIRLIWVDLMQFISEAINDVNLSSLTASLVKPFNDALPLIRDVLVQVENMILEIMREAAAAAGAIEQLNRGGRPGGGGGFSFQEVATGGMIRGPGTTTSDSILTWFPSAKTYAWTSNKEFVQPANAVSYYGVDFMEAIRRLKFPKEMFSLGGMVMPKFKIPSPSYATGGSVKASAGRSLTIVLDGQRFGLNGSTDVIDKLERVATMAGIASIGRPPGWVR